MLKKLTPPNWGDYDPNMLLNVSDAQYYFENFTEQVETNTIENKTAIDNLNGRVATLEQQIPVGPGGKGAYLDLGGTPERYPTAEEMKEGGNETGFMVVARTDGIYFYNPVTKLLIKPKKGGGLMAVHGQLPMVFDASHTMGHNGRQGLSGVYLAQTDTIGLDQFTHSDKTCTVVVAVTDKEEFQTAFHKDGFATRQFKDGSFTANWFYGATGGGGGGGGTIPPDLLDRIDELEKRPVVTSTKDLSDVGMDITTSPDSFLITSDLGKMIASKQHPLLMSGNTPINLNCTGAPVKVSGGNTNSPDVALSPFILNTGNAPRTVFLPKIVGRNKPDLGADEVREGRITFLSNTGGSAKTLSCNPADKFYVGNAHVPGPLAIPSKTTSVYLPAIVGSTASWVFFGNYTMEGDITALVNGFMDGKSPVSGNSVYGRILKQSIEFKQEAAKDYDTYMLIGATTRYALMPYIVDAMEPTLANNQVREGKEILMVVNTSGAAKFRVRPADGQALMINNISQTSDYDLARGDIQVFKAMKIDGKFTWYQVWRHSANDVGFTQQEKDGLANLMNKSHTFLNLSDTPGGYHPGKLVGYNLSGTALTPVDPIETFLNLKDTPNSFQGMARKTLVVRPDESGIDFVDTGSNSNDITTLFNHITRIDSEQSTQNKDISDLKTKSVKFTELSDTPSGYQPGKLVGYNLSGTGMVAVDPINSFKGMTDTPNTYTGHARKYVSVRQDESGVEFTTIPNYTNDINTLFNNVTRLDNEQYMQNRDITKNKDDLSSLKSDLTTGKKFVNLNSIGQKRWSTTGIISAAAVAQRPHVFATGNSAGLTITLPEIVSFDLETINANSQVREGRATYFYNHGSQPREILLGANDRFGIPGATTSISQILNPGVMHAYLPTINGTLKQWDLMFKCEINPSI